MTKQETKRTQIQLQDTEVQSLFNPDHLSPSSVEAYLFCPYSWYMTYVVGVRDLGMDMGPLAKGSILHNTLAELYKEVMQDPDGRITPDNKERFMARAEDIYQDVSHCYLAQNFPHSEIPIEWIEELNKTKQLLYKRIDKDATFLPGYKPWLIEEELEGEYAGYNFKGIVDRVDKNGDSFVVIDYKLGSMDAVSYLDEAVGVKKIQTALYAQLILKKYQDQVSHAAGTLYLSLGNDDKNIVGGAIDSSILYSPDLNTRPSLYEGISLTVLPPEYTVLLNNPQAADQEPQDTPDPTPPTFQDYLDAVEAYVAHHIVQMSRMSIPKRPNNEKGAYCIVLDACGQCEKGASYGH